MCADNRNGECPMHGPLHSLRRLVGTSSTATPVTLPDIPDWLRDLPREVRHNATLSRKNFHLEGRNLRQTPVVCAGVSVHQYGSWSGLWDLCGSEDPSGDLDRPVSGSTSAAGQSAVCYHQKHKTSMGGKKGVKVVDTLMDRHVQFE